MTSNQTSTGCPTIRAHFPAWTSGNLDDSVRREVREHLRGCQECHDALGRLDPSILFHDLRGGPLPAAFWESFNADLRARIDREEAGRASGPLRWLEALRTPGLAYVAAPAAMLLIVAAMMFVVRPDGFRPGPRGPRGDGITSPYAPPAAGRPGLLPRPADGPAAVASSVLGTRPGDLPPLEEVASPAARVYRFEAGGDDPTPIYLVVDESIDF
jgi:hypothetical protein